jgi:hypothetical protein
MKKAAPVLAEPRAAYVPPRAAMGGGGHAVPYCGAPASCLLSCFVARWFVGPERVGVLTLLRTFAMWQLLIS